MGIGDEIIASGHAKAVHRRTGKRVQIVDRYDRPRWHDVWEGLPYIVRPGENAAGAIKVRNGAQCRPYIRYPFNRKIGCTFSGWRVSDHVGEIRFSDAERRKAKAHAEALGPFVLVEPHVPPKSNPNKQWGWDKWQALVKPLRAERFQVAQFRLKGVPMLEGVTPIDTQSFREGAALLPHATGLILPEGGLHHAAGVLRLPAVVLFGGAVPTWATGYPWQTNIADDGEACGRWLPCSHCAEVWDRLTPQHVAETFLSNLIPAHA